MRNQIASRARLWRHAINFRLCQASEEGLLAQALLYLSAAGGVLSAAWFALRDIGFLEGDDPGVLLNGIVMLNGG